MKDESKTKKKLIRELSSLRQRVSRLDKIEAECKLGQKTLKLTNRILKIANENTKKIRLLQELTIEIKSFTGCDAVGIRLLNDKGNIPYEAYTGFSKSFYETESPLSIGSDKCMCVNVIKQETDPTLPFYTEGGSFYINGTSHFLATISAEEKGETRNMCNKVGYESVSLIPIRLKGMIYGLIHVADKLENKTPLAIVTTLEEISQHVAAAIIKVSAEERIRKSLQEKETLLREIHHRVKNNLQIIHSLLDLQSDQLENHEASKAIQNSQSRIKLMALIHEQLYQSDELSKINFAGYIKSLIADLLRSFGADPGLIKLNVHPENVYLSIDQAIPCGLIINELVSNSIKHAFPEGRGRKIDIGLIAIKDSLTLRIEDNGIGFPKDKDPKFAKSLGLRLVYLLTQQLEGSIMLHRSGGTAFEITFPKQL